MVQAVMGLQGLLSSVSQQWGGKRRGEAPGFGSLARHWVTSMGHWPQDPWGAELPAPPLQPALPERQWS